MRTVNVGFTILSVWDAENPGISDYIPLPVQHSIFPSVNEDVVVGDVLCFTSTVASHKGEILKAARLELFVSLLVKWYMSLLLDQWFNGKSWYISSKKLQYMSCLQILNTEDLKDTDRTYSRYLFPLFPLIIYLYIYIWLSMSLCIPCSGKNFGHKGYIRYLCQFKENELPMYSSSNRIAYIRHVQTQS